MKALIKVAAVIVILALFCVLNNCFLTARYNSSALYGAFTQKRERADAIDTEKVIIAGGSASNLGFDSQHFQKLSGKPAVNLSVSAGVPLRVYLQAAELCAKKGDVVLLPLEYDYYSREFDEISEGYVDMVGVDRELKCKDGFLGSVEYGYQSFLRSFTRINDCILFALREKIDTGNTIYIADSVDEYGDFCLHRDRAPTYQSVSYMGSFTHNPETLDAIQAFIEKMEKKGVTVYLTFPCVDKNYFVDNRQFFSEVQQVIGNHIDADNVIGTPEDFAYAPEYFYDTAYHLQYQYRETYTEELFRCYTQS